MVSLLVPTMNRPGFVERLLCYYAKLGFQGSICIADSSTSAEAERTKRAIAASRDSLDIIYREHPYLGAAESLQQLLDSVPTRYAALVGDDDFLVPAALQECALFLDTHPDYSAAHGVAAVVYPEAARPSEPGEWAASYYPQPVLEEDHASQRLLRLLSDYSVGLFSVHRIETWRRMYKDVHIVRDKTFSAELLPCCLSAVEGAIKELDCLYLVRQDHSRRYLLPDLYDWITTPDWLSSYQSFRDSLAQALVRQEEVSIETARATVKQAFWSYLAKALGANWEAQCALANPSPRNRLREALRAVPGARQVWHMLLSPRPERRRVLSLKTLRSPTSPYHKDFVPIYEAITEVPAELLPRTP